MTMTGTSMASPYVAGVAAYMLARQPNLTASQIAGMMRRTAKPLPGSDYQWQDDAGYGEIQPLACIEEVADVFRSNDLKGTPAGEGAHSRVSWPSTPTMATVCCFPPPRRRGGPDVEQHILIDGGRSTAFRENASDTVYALDRLDVVCVSHIDEDHIAGVVTLVEDMVEWRVHRFELGSDPDSTPPSFPEPPDIGEIWHNSLFDLVGDDIEPRVQPAMTTSAGISADLATRRCRIWVSGLPAWPPVSARRWNYLAASPPASSGSSAIVPRTS